MARTRHALLATAALMAIVATPALADDPDKPFGTDFGLSTPIIATGNNLVVTYYGSEGTTVFGHTLWAFTAAQYQANFANECFWWNAGAACGSISGYSLGTKAYGAAAAGLLASPVVNAPIGWTPGSEVIFALMVDQSDGFNWFFSGDPTRHTAAYSWPSSDPLAHLAYFGTNGVPGNLGVGTIPGTENKFLFGFEDVRYSPSDWDFNNAIFAIEFGGIDPPTEVVPEPATMTLLASGLLGLAAAQRRRRRTPEA
jgi:hypothetical protein